MNKQDISKHSLTELENLLTTSRKELVDLRFQLAINKLKSNTDINKKKKLIARILTRINHLKKQESLA